MKKITLLVSFVTLISFILATPATASRIQGAGAVDCGVWLTDRAEGSHNTGIAWLQGFISSYNLYHDEDAFGAVSWQSLVAYVDKFCRDNPLRSVSHAADAFIKREK